MKFNDKLTLEEKEILDDFQKGNFKVIPRTDPIYEKLYAAAEQKNTPINQKFSEQLLVN